MTQTSFTVDNAGSLTAALSAISNGGTDAAVNTGYTITLSQLIDLPAPPTPSAILALLSGSSLLLNGPGALQVASFLINTGTLSTNVGISGSATLDNAVLINAATFTGNIVNASGDSADIVVNTGSIGNAGTQPAIQLASGTVQSGLNGATTARIDGVYAGVQFTSGGVVQTDGTISASGTAGYGVFIGGAGMLTNGEAGATSALISGGGFGVAIEGAGTISNAATISGGGGAGIYLASGLVTNGGLVDTTALISGAGEGVWIDNGLGTVENFGTVRAGGFAGVYLGTGGTIVNGAPTDSVALIAGYQQGVLLNAGGLVTNYATITASETAATGEGVFLLAGGTLNNLGTAAVITGAGWGVVAESARGLVGNQGTIAATGGTGLGVDLTAGGTVVNGSASDTSALIAGSYDGVRILTGTNDVVRNFGTIEGSVGVDFNSSSVAAAGTLVNAGLVEGTGGYAVEFGSGSETLVLEPGGRFVGGVLGGAAGTTMLELAAGTKGTLSALGGDAGSVTDAAGSFAFQRIGTITLDSGASWAVTAPGTFDALDLSGTLEVQGGNVTVNHLDIAGGRLVMSGQTLLANTVTIDPAGNIIGYGTITGPVSNVGTITASGGTLELTGSVSGIGTLLVDPAAAMRLDLGASVGEVTVNAGSLASAGLLTVGQTGFDGLLVQNGATATTGISAVAGARGLDIAPTTSGSGESFVTGTHSLLSNTGRFVVGDAGVGALSIQSGGSVITTPGTTGIPAAIIAATTSASGSSVNVVGAGSNWQVGGALEVGDGGSGLLSIGNGASVTTTSLDAGVLAGSAGVIAVSGAKSDLTTSGSLSVGDAGSGELSILNGASVGIGGNLVIGQVAGGSGNVDVEGGTLNVAGNLALGAGGPGVLTVGPTAKVAVGGAISGGAFGVLNQFAPIDPDSISGTTVNINFNGPQTYPGFVDTSTFNIAQGFSFVLATPSITATSFNFNHGNLATTLELDSGLVDLNSAITFGGSNEVLVLGVDSVTPILSGGTGASVANPNLGVPVIGGFAAIIGGYVASDIIKVAVTQAATVVLDAVDAAINVVAASDPTNVLGVLSFATGRMATSAFTNHAVLVGLPCFAAGTLIETRAGLRAVEDLRAGDAVRTLLGGGCMPVVWLGHRVVDCARHPHPERVWPVRVAAGAFGAGQPARALYLSPDHAVYVEEVLIPVRYLLNGTTIRQEKRESVTYYHVELDCHEVIVAEGLAVESYLDTGTRAAFANGGGVTMLHADFAPPGDVWELAGCAPVVVTGPVLAAVREMVAEQRAVG